MKSYRCRQKNDFLSRPSWYTVSTDTEHLEHGGEGGHILSRVQFIHSARSGVAQSSLLLWVQFHQLWEQIAVTSTTEPERRVRWQIEAERLIFTLSSPMRNVPQHRKDQQLKPFSNVALRRKPCCRGVKTRWGAFECGSRTSSSTLWFCVLWSTSSASLSRLLSWGEYSVEPSSLS